MEVTVLKVVKNVEQAYMAKQDAITYFGYANHTDTFQRLLREFKNHKDFHEGYLCPTNGVPIINIEKFKEFLRWYEDNRYKVKK